MDPSGPHMKYVALFTTDASTLKEYYRGAEEEMPHRMPIRGVAVRTVAYVDSSLLNPSEHCTNETRASVGTV